jgi:hypothetical protein
MSRAAKIQSARLTVSKALSLRGQSKGYRKHNAASGNHADVIATSDGRRASGAEGVGVGGAVGRDGLGKSRASDGIAGDAVLVEDIVEGQTELSLIEAAACSECVVEEGIRDREGIDRGLVVILAVVLIESTDALVEQTKIPALALIGNAFGLDVGRSVGDQR